MSEQRWAQTAAEFDRLVELEPSERSQSLDQLRRHDPDLARAVEELLAADAAAEGLLERREEVLAPVAAGATPNLGLEWTVVRLLGRGGMGEVWLAERQYGDAKQYAAVKLLKRGMDSEGLLQRFLQERRILARLSHPAIATLLDAGIASDGRPFMAMDYIHGEALTVYARRVELGLRERLTLLAEIARAVDYAHRQLIVHRDLKPSNVLVDDEGRPHLLDFGIAKVLEDGDDTTLTGTGVRVLSPAYAAPEQVRGGEVGTAADVYGLGVLLYQLLVGRLPHRRSQRMDLLAQEITAERATRPSLAAAEEPVPGSSADARERLPWARQLRGDLDTLILKAIHPEPERRYPSAALLAEDIQRYLDGRPIRARPDNPGYRLGKFISRHRISVAIAGIASLALIASFGLAIWQAGRASAAAAQAVAQLQRAQAQIASAQAGKAFLLRTLERASGSASSDHRHAELLLQMAARIDTELALDPAAQAEIGRFLATQLAALGHRQRALELAERVRLACEQASGAAECPGEAGPPPL